MEFPASYIHPSHATHHTHTAILLHGLGSNGPEFAEELFSSVTSKGKTLPDALPTWRWVFPTSRDRLSTRFKEETCSWFDAYSLFDIQERQELQLEGLRESVTYILDILEGEIELLNGNTSHVYLGGISQGMATALWTLLCGRGRIYERLGGVFGFCGWLPFAHEMDMLIQQSEAISNESAKTQIQELICDFCTKTIKIPQEYEGMNGHIESSSLLATSVLLGHGTDDDRVSVELGRQALKIIKELTSNIRWKEYAGAEADGHWIKEPEGFDAILEFLEQGSKAV